MKKILILLLFATLLIGCDKEAKGKIDVVIEEADKSLDDLNMFVKIGKSNFYIPYDVVYCKSTKVMYTVSKDGVFTLLVNQYGTPMLYKGE